MEQGSPDDFGRETLAELERSHPDVVRLARVASLAVRIDRAFLREARLELLPGVPPDAEGDLWFSPLVESRSAAGLVLAPAVSHLLRQELARDAALLHDAWRLRLRFHPYLTPEMRLEEEVAWLALVEPGEETLNEALLRPVRAMALGGERAMGVARWALRAIPRLPERARRTEAALALAFGTAERMAFYPMLFEGTEEVPLPLALLQSVRASQAGAPCRVEVRLHEKALVLVEPAPEGSDSVMELPDTRPRLLELSWSAPVPGQKLLVAERLSVSVPLPAGVRGLTLRSMGGEFRLMATEPGGEARAAATEVQARAPESIDGDRQAVDSMPDWLQPRVLRTTVEMAEEQLLRNLLLGGEKVIVVEAPDGYGKSTLVHRAHAVLQSTFQWRTGLAQVRLQGMLIGTKGFLNNLFVEFPYSDWVAQKRHLEALRAAIDEAVPAWKGEAGERLAQAIFEVIPGTRVSIDEAGWEQVALEARRILLGRHAESLGELESLLGGAAAPSPLRGLTGRLVAEVGPKLHTAWARAMAAREVPSDAPGAPYAMRDRVLATLEREGIAGLEQLLERELLPCFRDQPLLILVDGLDSITQERAGEFVQLLMDWTLRRDPRWSCFRVVITATPGADRLTEVRYLPLAGFNAARIRQLGRLDALELTDEQADSLWRLTGGSARLVSLALSAMKRAGGRPYQLVWDEVLRKKTRYFDWLQRFPELLEALGMLVGAGETPPMDLPRLLDVGIIQRNGSDYAIRAKIFERLALHARDKVWPTAHEVDLYINAVPGELPPHVDDFLTRLRQRLEEDLGRELRVWVDTGEEGSHGPLRQSWVLVNVLTHAFVQSAPCRERLRLFQEMEEAGKSRQSLYLRAEEVPGEVLGGARVSTVELSQFASLELDRASPAYLEALSAEVVRAYGVLVSMMLRAPDVMSEVEIFSEVEILEDMVRSAEKVEMLQLIDNQFHAVEDALDQRLPKMVSPENIQSNLLPDNAEIGSVFSMERSSCSLLVESLALRGGGSATISAKVVLEPVVLYVYIDKSTYWGTLDDDERSLFPLLDANWNESMVETQPTVTLEATVLLSIETEAPDDAPKIRVVSVDEVTDIKLTDIHAREEA